MSKHISTKDHISVELLKNFNLIPQSPNIELEVPVDLPIENPDKSISLTHYFRNNYVNEDIIQIGQHSSKLEEELLRDFQNQKIPHQLPTDYFIGKLRNQTQYGWTTQPIIMLNQDEYENEIGIKKINAWSQKYLTENLLNRL